MNNADEPAYPLPEYPRANGMSKRERFAMAVLQGFLSAGQTDTPNFQGAMRYKGLAKESIRYADELLKELEETNDN